MIAQVLYDRYERRRILKSGIVSSMPIVILMPHSSCNCRCVMCDIWKDNHNLRQLAVADVEKLLVSLKKMGTKLVVMSGGEALLHKNFFTLCRILREANIGISLLSTGLLLKRHAQDLVTWVNDIVVSLDGPPSIHDQIRNIGGAFGKLQEGIRAIHDIAPDFKITGRTVIHKSNFRQWPEIIESAYAMGLKQISFLPADVSSHAFNRQELWATDRQQEIIPEQDDLVDLQAIINLLPKKFSGLFERGFIAESPSKLQKIHDYYAAYFGLNAYPYKKCNAPWVSAVIEADGAMRPCFFHDAFGNIHSGAAEDIINGIPAVNFRKALDVNSDSICEKCVCYLNLPAGKLPS